MTRAELEAAYDAMKAPSGNLWFMVNNTNQYWAQLREMLPGRHWIGAHNDGQALMSVYIPEDAKLVAMCIFADDDMQDHMPPQQMAMDHYIESARKHGPFPWEAGE